MLDAEICPQDFDPQLVLNDNLGVIGACFPSTTLIYAVSDPVIRALLSCRADHHRPVFLVRPEAGEDIFAATRNQDGWLVGR
jgi:hypothetical protein